MRAGSGALHFLKLPLLFLNPRLQRRREWPDAQDDVPVLANAA